MHDVTQTRTDAPDSAASMASPPAAAQALPAWDLSDLYAAPDDPRFRRSRSPVVELDT